MFRRLYCVLLAGCLVFALSPAACALRDGGFALHSLTVEADGVTVNLLAERGCTLVAALYGGDGALLGSGMVPVTGEAQMREYKVPIAGGSTGCDRARAFLLDSETWEPLCESIPEGVSIRQQIAALGLPESWQEELLRAAALGFPMEKLEQSTVSGQDMAALLDRLVQVAAPDRLTEWQTLLPNLSSYEEPLTRFDAMGALFLAAQTIGGRWAEPVESVYQVWSELEISWDRGYFTGGLFPDDAYGQHYFAPLAAGELHYLDMACLCYNLSRVSSLSGEFPFAYDAETHSIREDDSPTYAEAALSVIRLLLSDDGAGEAEPVKTLTREKDAQLHADLQSAIDDILNTETEIVHSDTFLPGETYTGTAYYVSADGDDGSDGLTPETAWKSLSKVIYETGGWREEPGTVRTGDAVFFRRGDVFRFPVDAGERTINIRTSGITFSAYGEGDKPVITGSSQSGVGAEKWKLVYEDEASGQKIWQFYQDLRDVACVALNDGEIITNRVYEFWNGSEYVSCECESGTWLMDMNKGVTLKDGLLPLQESLTEDLTIISRPAHMRFGNVDDGVTGPLYLRCDAGNPGEIYHSIEFAELETMSLVWMEAGGSVFDNLSFRCGGNSFMKTAGGANWEGWSLREDAARNVVVQNCEFTSGGGGVAAYYTIDGQHYLFVQGDGIYGVICDATFCRNYFHDMLSGAIGFEGYYEEDPPEDLEPTRGFFHVLDNVLVNTIGVRLDSTSEILKHLDSVVIQGNRIWNTGGMDRGGYYYSEGSVLFTNNHYSEFRVEDNVLYGTENGPESNGLFNLLIPNPAESVMPVFRNNTYVQYPDRPFLYVLSKDSSWNMGDPDLMYYVRRLLRDTTSEFYVIGEPVH